MAPMSFGHNPLVSATLLATQCDEMCLAHLTHFFLQTWDATSRGETRPREISRFSKKSWCRLEKNLF